MDEYIKTYVPFFESEDSLEETIHWKYVVRDGKKVRKPLSDNSSMKIEYGSSGNPKEVRKTGTEIAQMSRKNTRSARKSKGKKQSTNRKIARSTAKHTWS